MIYILKKVYHSEGINKFSTLNFNDLNCHCNFNFPLAKPNLKFINVDKNSELIHKSLINLGSGIYLFWLLLAFAYASTPLNVI